MISDSLKVFSGNANPKLAHAVAQYLNIPLGRATVNRFSDGEVMVEINENVRGCDAFVLQSTCAPTNDNLMELMIMVDALRRASCRRITAVMPYYGYARQDRRPRSARVAISAKVVANMLQSVGIDRVLTMDLHADQIQGFFDVPVDNIYSTPVLLNDLVSHQYPDLMVVSPDVGGVVRARAMAKELGVDLIEVDGKALAENQLSQVENFITQGVDGIILNPYDADGCAPAVTAAKNAGIPIVVVNAKTSNVEEADAFVGSDDVIGGEMEMQYVADQLGGKGTIVIMSGLYGNSAQIDRQQGIENILANYPDITVYAEQTGNWVRDEGMTLMENWLQSGEKIDAVVAHNDQMALGALQAIEEANPENDIIIIGIDAIADAVNSVANGGMTATILQDGQGQGASALETVVKVIKGESFEKAVNIPFILITKDNVADYQ